MAATLPGVDVRAALFDGTAVYLPGEDVPAGEYLLLTHVPETQGAVLSIETLDQNGASQERTLENSKEVEVSLSADSVLYLRIRLSVDGVEERVWVSPFFGSEGL